MPHFESLDGFQNAGATAALQGRDNEPHPDWTVEQVEAYQRGHDLVEPHERGLHSQEVSMLPRDARLAWVESRLASQTA